VQWLQRFCGPVSFNSSVLSRLYDNVEAPRLAEETELLCVSSSSFAELKYLKNLKVHSFSGSDFA
jgi:hypothetical protein